MSARTDEETLTPGEGTVSPRPARAAATARRLDPTRFLQGGYRLLARFGTVGALSFVVDAGGYNLLRHALELGPVTSKTIAVLLATTVAFVGSRSWTFAERRQRRTDHAYLMFGLVNGVSLLLGVGCLAFSTYVLGLDSPLAENISGNLVGVGLGTLFRFYAYHRWVFPGDR
ncbi:GtrA family protein [Nocardioides bruguierae]|uniref:GtrA family protein n=1 Tax=Nocardioides bruguierae TaxID=2945102 RepID=A0A9X2D7E6_9ACTN|nr:GtrA family protein [Nocardioides bruguierae]MCL8025415.1 GtrA family protein [Nocardioides bruguierae]MCM0620592.1 GtrA family protein [Nocardioides bruguierae]